MKNQTTFEFLYHSLYDEDEEVLEHHGVEGQSWGDRNGPPYPLKGVDKKVARAEYKAKKEKERKLKKMQKAAKKARKVKAKNAKLEAEILKKKQKLLKQGDLDKIRKNANLFSNEELKYVLERDAAKKALSNKKERTDDERFELAMKRASQLGSIALNAKGVFEAAKAGADMISAFKGTKLKDIDMEDKRRSAIKTEFEMRFKGREQSDEAQRFIDMAINNKDYQPSKAEKAENIQDQKERLADVKRREKEMKGQKGGLFKKKDKGGNNGGYENKNDRDYKDVEKGIEKAKKDYEKKQDKSVKDFSKGLSDRDAWDYVQRKNDANQRLKQQYGEATDEIMGKTYGSLKQSPYTTSGEDFVKSYFSAPGSWKTYIAQTSYPTSVKGASSGGYGNYKSNFGSSNANDYLKKGSADSVTNPTSSISYKHQSGVTSPYAGKDVWSRASEAYKHKTGLTSSSTGRDAWSKAVGVNVHSKPNPSAYGKDGWQKTERVEKVLKDADETLKRIEASEKQREAREAYEREERKREEKIRAGASIGGYKAQREYYNKALTWLRDTGGLKDMSRKQMAQLSEASKKVGQKETERLLERWWEAPDQLLR